MPARTAEEVDSILEAVKDLYVSYRKRWILQDSDGTGYSQISRFKLHDDFIRNHIKGKDTIGIFARSDYIKFLTFDVDVGKDEIVNRHYEQMKAVYGDVKNKPTKNQIARWITLRLIHVLVEDFGINRENLLVSFSGNKGYHVTFFFDDKTVTEEKAKKFHDIVRESINALPEEVEFRPKHSVGVKIPFGKHKETGNYCHLVDLDKLEYVDDSKIFDVVKVDSKQFLVNLIEFEKLYDKRKQKIKKDVKQKMNLSPTKEKQIEQVLDDVNLGIPIAYEEWLQTMLERNCLLYPNSRDKSCYHLCIYLKDEFELEQDVTEGIVRGIILNTYENARHLINVNTRLNYAISEVSRICDYVYKHDKKIHREGIVKTIRIHENELLEVLKSNRIHLMRLAFIMLLHSKKYAKRNQIFYMTYEQMADYGADRNGKRLLEHLKRLQEMEFLEIVARNRKRKNENHLPNLYRVNVIPDEASNYIEFDVNDVVEMRLEEIVAKLIPKKEIKKILTKSIFYENFSEFYKKTI